MRAIALTCSAHAATFRVTKTSDTDDGACNADCSLREAINAANGAAGDDIIDFGVTGTPHVAEATARPR